MYRTTPSMCWTSAAGTWQNVPSICPAIPSTYHTIFSMCQDVPPRLQVLHTVPMPLNAPTSTSHTHHKRAERGILYDIEVCKSIFAFI